MFFKYFCLFTIDSTSTPEVLRHEPKVRLVGGRDRSSGRLEIKLPPDTLYHPKLAAMIYSAPINILQTPI
jgi:hypothetical protein